MTTEWRILNSFSENHPPEIDNTSSHVYVYIRKDFVKKQFTLETDIPGEKPEILDGWEFLEQKISKEDWNMYAEIMNNQKQTEISEEGIVDLASTINDHDEAIMELAELVSLLQENGGE